MNIARYTALALGLLVSVSQPVVEAQTSHSRIVPFGDLELDRFEDALVLLERIDRAADRTCRRGEAVRSVELLAAVNACRDAAARDAVQRLENPRLIALYERTRLASR